MSRKRIYIERIPDFLASAYEKATRLVIDSYYSPVADEVVSHLDGRKNTQSVTQSVGKIQFYDLHAFEQKGGQNEVRRRKFLLPSPQCR